MSRISALQKARAAYQPKLPPALAKGAAVKICAGAPTTAAGDVEAIKGLFKATFGSPVLTFEAADGKADMPAVTVGVILSGGQAPGGHNVIAGIFAQAFCLLAFLFLGDGLNYCLLYNVTNLRP